MAMRSPAGFISAFFDPLKNPNAPTSPSATAGDASASVSFTAPDNVGGSAITAYYAVSNPGQITGTAATSPVSVTGLTNGTAYTFNVWALNSYGPGVWSVASGSITPAAVTAVFGGNSSWATTIVQTSINTLGNTTSFGDLSVGRGYLGSCASLTRAFFIGGLSGGTGVGNNTCVIDYVTFSTGGAATYFGDMGDAGARLSGLSNTTRGVYTLGDRSAGLTNAMYYITLATTGNGTYFGDMTIRRHQTVACASPTRGIFAAGDSTGNNNTINYITIASTGNAAYFGALITSPSGALANGMCCSDTRGIFAGGYNSGTPVNTIQYITIATTGDATNFGSLSSTLVTAASASSTTRGLFAGGSSGSYTNAISYITIATAGNAVSFGQITYTCLNGTGASNSHGGL